MENDGRNFAREHYISPLFLLFIYIDLVLKQSLKLGITSLLVPHNFVLDMNVSYLIDYPADLTIRIERVCPANTRLTVFDVGQISNQH